MEDLLRAQKILIAFLVIAIIVVIIDAVLLVLYYMQKSKEEQEGGSGGNMKVALTPIFGIYYSYVDGKKIYSDYVVINKDKRFEYVTAQTKAKGSYKLVEKDGHMEIELRVGPYKAIGTIGDGVIAMGNEYYCKGDWNLATDKTDGRLLNAGTAKSGSTMSTLLLNRGTNLSRKVAEKIKGEYHEYVNGELSSGYLVLNPKGLYDYYKDGVAYGGIYQVSDNGDTFSITFTGSGGLGSGIIRGGALTVSGMYFCKNGMLLNTGDGSSDRKDKLDKKEEKKEKKKDSWLPAIRKASKSDKLPAIKEKKLPAVKEPREKRLPAVRERKINEYKAQKIREKQERREQKEQERREQKEQREKLPKENLKAQAKEKIKLDKKQYDFTFEVIDSSVIVTGLVSSATTTLDIPQTVTLNDKTYTVSAIAADAFKNKALQSVSLPDTVTTIGNGAFARCLKLRAFRIPNSVVSVGSKAFENCNQLKDVTIGIGVTTIGNHAFSGCAVENVQILNNVKLLGQGAFKSCENLTEISFGTGLEKLDANLCNGCTSLSKVVIFDSVKTISKQAFANCGMLTSVIFGKGIHTIGEGAFSGCTSLDNVNIPDSVTTIEAFAFSKCVTLTNLVISDNANKIGRGAFSGCSSLVNLIIPDSVTTIEEGAFSNCSSVLELVVPDSVNTIGKGAFNGCNKLVDISLPFVGESRDLYKHSHFGYVFGAETYARNSTFVPLSIKNVLITSANAIDAKAFSGCSALENISINDIVSSIGVEAFLDCKNLSSITIPFVGIEDGATDNTHLGRMFKECDKSNNAAAVPDTLKTVVITQATSIPNYAFYNCSRIKNVTMPDTVKKIGVNAFNGCTALQRLDLPDAITEIGDNAFANVHGHGFPSIELPNTLTNIGQGVFSGWTTVESITLPFVGMKNNAEKYCHFGYIFGAETPDENGVYVPKSLKTVKVQNAVKLGENAFSGCAFLSSVTLADGLTVISSNAFHGCTALKGIAVPKTVSIMGKGVFSGCSALETLSIPFVGNQNNANVYTHLGYIFGGEKADDNAAVVPQSLKTVNVSQGTQIGSKAFYGCSNLMTVTLPSKLTDIGSYAFSGTSIANIKIPDSVSSIGTCAFSECDGLKSISLPKSLKAVGRSAFSGCKSLSNVVFNGKELTQILDNAFSGCSEMTAITLPGTLQTIGVEAFAECKDLSLAKFDGTAATFKTKVVLGDNWCGDTRIGQIQCIDGAVVV